MKLGILPTALLFSTQAALVLGFYDAKDAVVELNSKNFRSQVLETPQLTAVEFYAPWCGHCQKLTPEWKKVASNLKGLVTVAAINCDEDSNKQICSQYKITGFPTIKLFRPETNKKGILTKKPTDYQGPREAKPLVDHLLSVQPSNVRFVKDDASSVKSQKSISIDDFLAAENTTMPKVFLFTDKATTTPLYKALSVEFGDRMLVGEVKKTEKGIMTMFNVKSFPTLLVHTPKDGTHVYEGKLKYEMLHEFLETHAPQIDTKKSKQSKQSKNTEEASPVKEKEPIPHLQVQEFSSDETFAKHCLDTSKICVVAVVQNEDKDISLAMFKSLNEASNKFGLFQFGWMTDEKAVAVVEKLDLVRDFPTLFILHPTKQLYRPYVGAWDEKKISQWLGSISSGKISAWPYQGVLSIASVSNNQQHDEL
ncbi:hypothetical protein BDF14DRAFT_1841102 [Spinellus fusiger]|nr:hypothetical protein BDF14DRAFT_1841102 [Spinellus fusiger]